MNGIFCNDIIFSIRNFMNGEPKFVFSHVINEIDKFPTFQKFNNTEIVFVNSHENVENYHLQNFQVEYNFIFFDDDITYKKAFDVSRRRTFSCSLCGKQIYLICNKSDSSISKEFKLIITEHWHNLNIITKYCDRCQLNFPYF